MSSETCFSRARWAPLHHTQKWRIELVLILKKKETGYPQKHRVDWAKIHGDKVIKLAKLFYAAGMDKGITIALQSLNPKSVSSIALC